MTGYRPTFEVSVKAKKFNSGTAQAPTKISLDWNTLPCSDILRLEFPVEIDDFFQVDDPVELQLGYDDKNIKIFSGQIIELKKNISKIELVAFNQIEKLANLRVVQSYEGQAAGDIISDICNTAGVDIGNITNGIKFFVYYLDREKNCYEHIFELAQKCGFVIYLDEQNKLNFIDPTGSDVKHTFEYKKDLLECLSIAKKKFYTGVRVFGESPASSEGDDTASWLTKNEDIVKGESEDTSGEVLHIYDSSLRTQEATNFRAKAENSRIEKGSLYGQLKVLGNPELFPSNTFNVEGFPLIESGKTLFITGVSHHVSQNKGFTTIVEFKEA